MLSPSKTFDSAIAGVNDFMTSPAKKAALTYNRPAAAAPQPTYKFARPKTDADIQAGRNNAQDISKLPKGTIIGAPTQTSQSKALRAKLK